MSAHTANHARQTVLFVGHDAFRAGAQIALLHLIRWFRDRGGYDVVVVLKRGGELLSEYEAAAPTYVLGNRGARHERWPRWRGWRSSAWESVRSRRVDLVYINTVAALDVVEDVAARWRCPIICHVHELAMSIQKFCGVAQFRQQAPAITAFVAASRAVERHLVEYFGIPSHRVHVVYEGIALPEEGAEHPVRGRIAAVPEHAFVVGGCGTVEWRKGPDAFVQAARLVQRAAPEERPVHFVWVGGPTTGLDYEQLQFDINRMGLSDVVHFVGHQQNPGVYVSRFDVFFLTSREDPFPLACLEAAAIGVPILCFADAGGMPEFVQDDAGAVVPYLDVDAAADQILSLMWAPELRAKLGRCAAAKVRARNGIGQIGQEIAAVVDRYTPAPEEVHRG